MCKEESQRESYKDGLAFGRNIHTHTIYNLSTQWTMIVLVAKLKLTMSANFLIMILKVEEFSHINGWDSTFEVMGSRTSSGVSTPVSEQSDGKTDLQASNKVRGDALCLT